MTPEVRHNACFRFPSCISVSSYPQSLTAPSAFFLRLSSWSHAPPIADACRASFWGNVLGNPINRGPKTLILLPTKSLLLCSYPIGFSHEPFCSLLVMVTNPNLRPWPLCVIGIPSAPQSPSFPCHAARERTAELKTLPHNPPSPHVHLPTTPTPMSYFADT